MFLCYPYPVMANLFIKHIPPRVAKKYYTKKKLTSKLQQIAIIEFLYCPALIIANLFKKH